MFQKCCFADATSKLEDADYSIVGLPFDSTSSFRSGSRDGPDAIRKASFGFESYDSHYDVDLSDCKICDLGNMDLGSDPAYARDAIRGGISLLSKGIVPIFLGGEHSITPAIVESLSKQGSMCVIVFDAHLDLRDEYGCTRFSHACASRRILETTGVEAYAAIGTRSGSREEYDYAAKNHIAYFTSNEVRTKGIDRILDLVIEKLNGRPVYISIDMDALDPSYAPAVGNPEPFGLTSWDVKRAIERVAPMAVGMDINEVTPIYDHGETAVLAARILREFIAAKEKQKKERKTTDCRLML